MTSRVPIRLGIAVVLTVGAALTHHEEARATLRLVRSPASLASPVFVTNAGDGTNRLFIVERAGVIKVLQPGATIPTVFLDISAKVTLGGERGLLGLTFHPQFSSNRRFFVNYSRLTDSASVIAEYAASVGNPNQADTTETVILAISQAATVHIAGMIEFGPLGLLYIAMGDGDQSDRAQDIEELHGKILRIDVDTPNGPVPYSSPLDNPFFGPITGADEIYAYGFRNPWRFSFDRDTGDLYVGDVGNASVEEINTVTLGGNYGWHIWEGSSCSGIDPPQCVAGSYIFPITEYGHAGGRCSVIGGYVYRGAQATLLPGTYLFGDLCSGEIFALEGGAVSIALQNPDLAITSFGEDEAGELYVVGFGADSGLHRLVDVLPTTARDFNADDRADILWKNTTSGSLAVWLLDGTAVTVAGTPGGPTADWQLVSVGDFNGDGRTDILWRHNTGTVAVWFLDGATVLGTAMLGAVGGSDWQIVRVGDFNGDGKDDLLWHNTISDTYAMWMVSGTGVLWTGTLEPNSPGAGWQVAGIGDFNGDGKDDILWRDGTGAVATWLMNATKALHSGTLGAPANEWQVVRVGDFDGDGRADILWRNVSGLLAVWLVNGTTLVTAGFPGAPGNDWQVKSVADFNGDGRVDILWRHDSGTPAIWFMNGTALNTTGDLGQVGAIWQIQ